MAAGQPSVDSKYDNFREAAPKPQSLHQRRASRDGYDFGQGTEFVPKEDGIVLPSNHERQPRHHPSAVTLSTEAVGPHAESGAPPVKSTSIDAFKHNTPGNQISENGASEGSGGEAAARNQGTGPSPLHPQAYQGRLGKKLQQDHKSEKRHSESGSTIKPDKGALLPKFGEWDVNDPASGEGFTVIFDKARDEKKTGGAARIPTLQGDSASATNYGGDSQKMQGAPESSCPSWLSCCFHRRGTK